MRKFHTRKKFGRFLSNNSQTWFGQLWVPMRERVLQTEAYFKVSLYVFTQYKIK